MTTAIEQAKREMYNLLSSVMQQTSHPTTLRLFEAEMESYLEQLRQQYEEMASTAHQRFESIQSLEKVNQDLIDQLAKMTESRDMFRNLHQAATHASIERVGQASTSGQTSGDRAYCEQPDAKTMAIIGALVDAQRVMVEYLVPDGIRAKDAIGKMIPILDNEKLCLAMDAFEKPRCQHAWVSHNFGTPVCSRCGIAHRIGKEDTYAARVTNNDKCMHSFFAIGDDKMKCTFCGVGK